MPRRIQFHFPFRQKTRRSNPPTIQEIVDAKMSHDKLSVLNQSLGDVFFRTVSKAELEKKVIGSNLLEQVSPTPILIPSFRSLVHGDHYSKPSLKFQLPDSSDPVNQVEHPRTRRRLGALKNWFSSALWRSPNRILPVRQTKHLRPTGVPQTRVRIAQGSEHRPKVKVSEVCELEKIDPTSPAPLLLQKGVRNANDDPIGRKGSTGEQIAADCHVTKSSDEKSVLADCDGGSRVSENHSTPHSGLVHNALITVDNPTLIIVTEQTILNEEEEDGENCAQSSGMDNQSAMGKKSGHLKKKTQHESKRAVARGGKKTKKRRTSERKPVKDELNRTEYNPRPRPARPVSPDNASTDSHLANWCQRVCENDRRLQCHSGRRVLCTDHNMLVNLPRGSHCGQLSPGCECPHPTDQHVPMTRSCDRDSSVLKRQANEMIEELIGQLAWKMADGLLGSYAQSLASRSHVGGTAGLLRTMLGYKRKPCQDHCVLRQL